MMAPVLASASRWRAGPLRDTAAGRPSELHRLQLPASLDPTADVLDHLPDGDAHGHFHQPASVDFAGQREDLGPLAAFRSERGEGAGAAAHDPGHAGQRLDVVDQRRTAAKSPLDGEGRPQPGHAALSFQ
jgi:hypothetical protein